ncbi:MAG: tyrosine-type recombinase/integrase, partial [Streptococcus mitis]|nr:tyrosine-type recombinase/integrase [Streptococcus mitis]
IDRDVLEYLRPYMQWRRQWFVSPPDNPTLFFLNNGKPMSPNGVQYLLKQVNRHYNGKQVSSNFIRQSFAINMYKTTGSLTATQEYLGFGSSAMMTRIIATVDEERKKNRL